MSARLSFVMVLHSHQPVGNFDSVFEQAYRQCYLPFVEELLRSPLPVCLHYSGPLLEWLDSHRPELFDQLREIAGAQSGQVEFIVCDGVLGNVVLKTSEGLAETLDFRLEFSGSWLAQLGYFLSRGVFSRIRKRLDYAEYGGAPLLGIQGTTVICHGRSNARAISGALGVAVACERRKVNESIRAEIARLTETEAARAASSSTPPRKAARR